jgi:hypothetical protein
VVNSHLLLPAASLLPAPSLLSPSLTLPSLEADKKPGTEPEGGTLLTAFGVQNPGHSLAHPGGLWAEGEAPAGEKGTEATC